MNSVKLIHVLLIAFLCYGQIVSIVHSAGHFKLPNHAAGRSAGHEAHHTFTETSALSVAHYSHVTNADSDHHAEPNCEIYHAFLSQAVATNAAPPMLQPESLKNFTRSHFTPQHIVGNAREYHSIRGPPQFS